MLHEGRFLQGRIYDRFLLLMTGAFLFAGLAISVVQVAASEDYSNHLWLSIQDPARSEVAIHIPGGFTNRVEILTCTNLLDSRWALVATNLLAQGTNTIYWTCEMARQRTGPVFVVFGNADIDSDGDGMVDTREKYLYRTDPSLLDTDGDGAGDGDELAGGTNPTNPNDPPNVKGTIVYGGEQTNVIQVLVVTDSNSWSLARSTTLSAPGFYQITRLPGSNYFVKAFRDMNNDGLLGSIEARGQAACGQVEITTQVTHADVLLVDPDTDDDGFSDYDELYLTDTSPTNNMDGVVLLETARRQIIEHWQMIYSTPLSFTNTPGSAEDMNDIREALNALSNEFYEPGVE